MTTKFPKDFIWGTATSSYQIEGAVNEGGRGETIWDHFCKTTSKIANADNGDTACNHYHRYKEDIQLMKNLNIKSYRFSICWSRILPEGTGKVNPIGLQFYRSIIETLIENDIEPIITLYHWELPQVLQEKGGWENPKIINDFMNYANVIFNEFGDVVKKWITLNEPMVFTYLGYLKGIHAPGIADEISGAKAVHHALLAHGETVKLFRKLYPSEGQIGITLNLAPMYPSEDTIKAQEAAHISDGFTNRMFLDPILKGTYPEDILVIIKQQIQEPSVTNNFTIEKDLKTISQPIDFIGINYYSAGFVKEGKQKYEVEPVEMDAPKTDMGWPVTPEGIYDLLIRIKNDYGNIPLYITENGAAYKDNINEKGEIEDMERIEYLKSHLLMCQKAIADGVNLKGYYLWSFLDNFEWIDGYTKRFGIVYVDFKSQKRLPKKSAYFYKNVIDQNGLSLL
ncbi:GH1 family beta-glucosidase [Chengkuizengella axinellae]|uniref:Beta-glucosidase n=1 Tax=Chengkuizengella axinellae TaxID=3064388 RepID=A0ABT9J2D8_9BACL|nr:GH1 family beta-glucosidase [Chengkuizengella sp. 2205SS18-9]MDP5275757.1 GH1 family beta-glucosidase [Chengkuizengella sp. 2205SS18-9]